MTEPDLRKRRCRECNKVLSQYNLSQYCFVHQTLGKKNEDDEYVAKLKYVAERAKARKKREELEDGKKPNNKRKVKRNKKHDKRS